MDSKNPPGLTQNLTFSSPLPLRPPTLLSLLSLKLIEGLSYAIFSSTAKPTSSRAFPSHLPYQLVQVLVVDMGVHVGEIAAHRKDEILGAVQLVLRLNEVDEFFDLFFLFCLFVRGCWRKSFFLSCILWGERERRKKGEKGEVKLETSLGAQCSPLSADSEKGLTVLGG